MTAAALDDDDAGPTRPVVRRTEAVVRPASGDGQSSPDKDPEDPPRALGRTRSLQLSPRAVHQLAEASEEVELEYSVWDSSLLLGTRVIGPAASAFLLLLILVNVALQLSFANVVKNLAADPDVTRGDVEDLKWWRRNIAHSVEYYNAEKGKSLARRVCEKDFGLETSTFQASLHGILDDYLGAYLDERGPSVMTGGGPESFRGAYLCMLAVCLWVMTVFVDFRGSMNTITALNALRGAETDIVLDRESRVVIRGVSRARFLGCLSVQLVRVFISVVLIYFGSIYLVQTMEVSELILNAVALEFVLRVDELIFACFAPARVKVLLKKTRPLEAPPLFRTRGGLDFRSFASFVLCLALILSIYFTSLLPRVEVLESAQHAMCGGDLDVVYAVDGLGVPWWAPTKIFPASGEDALEPFNYPDGEPEKELKSEDANEPYGGREDRGPMGKIVLDAVLQQHGRPYVQSRCDFELCVNITAMWGPDYPVVNFEAPRCCLARAFRLPDPQFVKARATEDFSESVALRNPSAFDVLNLPFDMAYTWKVALAETVPSHACGGCPHSAPLCDASTRRCIPAAQVDCEAAAPFCHAVNETGRRARAACPYRCGCVFPPSTQALTQDFEGCVIDKSGPHQSFLRALPCVDASPVGEHSWMWPYFLGFLDNMERISLNYALVSRRVYQRDISFLRQHGCSYLSDPRLWDSLDDSASFRRDATNASLGKPPYFMGRNPCVRNAFHKPLSFFCPVACGCRRGDQDCYLTCPSREASEPACPAHMPQATLLREYGQFCPKRPAAHPFDAGLPADEYQPEFSLLGSPEEWFRDYAPPLSAIVSPHRPD